MCVAGPLTRGVVVPCSFTVRAGMRAEAVAGVCAPMSVTKNDSLARRATPVESCVGRYRVCITIDARLEDPISAPVSNGFQ